MNLFYVQVIDDKFIRYIHDIEPTQWDDNNFCRIPKLTPEQIEHFGIHQLKLVTPPYFDEATQIRELGPALKIDGVWTQNYIVSELDAEVAATKIEAQWVVIRNERNKLLTNTDWWVTKASENGVNISPEQQVYRQALRDVTEQINPFDIQWPVAPSAGD